MHSNGMRLLKLINDLLDLVRLESGRMEVKREPLEVAEFVKGLASAARQVADDKRLRLETFVDPALGTVLADRDKLEKIVLNLVFNALKFTPAGGRVELRAEKQDEEFVLTVADTGMGISEKNLPHRVRPLLAGGRFLQAQVPGRGHRAGAGEGIGRDPGRQGHRPEPGRQGHHVYRAVALSSKPSRRSRQARSDADEKPIRRESVPALLPPRNGWRICIGARNCSPR